MAKVKVESEPKLKFNIEMAAVNGLRPHPRNYRTHTEDQLDHLIKSVKDYGVYKNVVTARDGTILAGHGVVAASRKMKLKKIPIIRLDVDPEDSKALKVLTGDNEIAHLAEVDDRMLTEVLKEIKDVNLDGLFGTGYDDAMLAALAFVTRPASEIADFNEAAEWVGMPEFGEFSDPIKLVVCFRSEEDRTAFAKKLDLELSEKARSTWWPSRDQEDLSSIKFEG